MERALAAKVKTKVMQNSQVSKIAPIYGTNMVYRVVSFEGKKYKFIADDPEFVKAFFSVKGKCQSIEVLRVAADADFDNLKSLG